MEGEQREVASVWDGVGIFLFLKPFVGAEITASIILNARLARMAKKLVRTGYYPLERADFQTLRPARANR